MAVGSFFVVDGSLQPPDVWTFYAIAAAPAVAMGLQNATLRQVAGQTIHTTYVTGVLQSMSEGVVQYAFWLADQRRQRGIGAALRASGDHPSLRAASAAVLVWLAYVMGAIGGGLSSRRWALFALALPLAALIVAAVSDFFRSLDD
jgi:uncharacterized membrane protein YoaK (UPF0700 family)